MQKMLYLGNQKGYVSDGFTCSAIIFRDFILSSTAKWQSQATKLAQNSFCGIMINWWRDKPVLSKVSCDLLAKYLGYLKIIYFTVYTRNKVEAA